MELFDKRFPERTIKILLASMIIHEQSISNSAYPSISHKVSDNIRLINVFTTISLRIAPLARRITQRERFLAGGDGNFVFFVYVIHKGAICTVKFHGVSVAYVETSLGELRLRGRGKWPGVLLRCKGETLPIRAAEDMAAQILAVDGRSDIRQPGQRFLRRTSVGISLANAYDRVL